MAIKVVIIMQETTLLAVGGQVSPVSFPQIGYASRQHIAGWTESVYWGTDNVSDCITALKNGANGQQGLLPARALCLNSASQIVGVRLYQGGAGKGFSLAVAYVGNGGDQSDIPQMALLCKGGGINTTSTRRWTLRGIPDAEVVNGEFRPDAFFLSALTAYFGALGNFGFRGVDPVASKSIAIFKVGADGSVTTVGLANPFAVPSIVKISRTVDADGVLRSQTGTIKTPTVPGTQFLFDGWNFGACEKGKAIQNVLNFFAFKPDTIAASRIVTRRVGRPFEQYRGRASKKRRTA